MSETSRDAGELEDNIESNASLSDSPNLTEQPGSTEWPGLNLEATTDVSTGERGDSELHSAVDPKNWPNIDQFVIQEYLGGGGFGDVFKALSIKLGGPVAIKILKPKYARDPAIAKRFQLEVQAAALTRHTHVVQVLDKDVSAEPPYENCPYLVTEYLPGGDFAAWLKSHTPPSEHVDATIRILIGVCRGLEAIHRHGIVHRDIKPENILIDAEGIPKIGDFGLSVLDINADIRMTGSHQIFGTLPYMAPEQILSAKNAVPASDQYAIGVILYVILCRLRPWQETATDDKERSRILSNLTSVPPEPLRKNRQADARLQEICLRCLQPLPEDRYPNVKDLRIDLEAWLHSDPSVTSEPYHEKVRFTVIKIAVILMLVAFFWTWHRGGGRDQPQNAKSESIIKAEDIEGETNEITTHANEAQGIVDQTAHANQVSICRFLARFNAEMTIWDSNEKKYRIKSAEDFPESASQAELRAVNSGELDDTSFCNFIRLIGELPYGDLTWTIHVQSWKVTNQSLLKIKPLNVNYLSSWGTNIKPSVLGEQLKGFRIAQWDLGGSATSDDIQAIAAHVPVVVLFFHCNPGVGPDPKALASLQNSDVCVLNLLATENPPAHLGRDRLAALSNLTQLKLLHFVGYQAFDDDSLNALSERIPNTTIWVRGKTVKSPNHEQVRRLLASSGLRFHGFASAVMKVPDRYRLRFRVKRTSQRNNGLSLQLRVGDSHVSLTLGGRSGGVTGIGEIDAAGVSGNEARMNQNPFPDHQSKIVAVNVTTNSVELMIDEERVLQWKGDPSSFSVSPVDRLSHLGDIYFSTESEGVFHISELTLESLDD